MKTVKKDYAVIKIQGRQYKVSEKDEILVDKLGDQKPEAEILLAVKDGKVSVGKPTVKTAKIGLKVLGEEKGEKVEVVKYKSKSRYKRHTGFRAQYTRLLIQKLSQYLFLIS